MDRIFQERARSQELVAAEPGLTASEARATLRRQFIGSAAAAVAVMIAVGLTALRPVHEIASNEATHRVFVVQQATFVTPEDRVIASRQH